MNHPFPVAAVSLARLSFSLSLAFPRTYHHPRGTIKSQKRATVIYVYCARGTQSGTEYSVPPQNGVPASRCCPTASM